MRRYEDIHLDDGMRHAGLIDSDCRDCKAYEKRIEELERRLRLIQEWMEQTDMTDPDITDIYSWVWEAFEDKYIEATGWFDDEGNVK